MHDPSSNDAHFDPAAQLAALPQAQALDYLHDIVDTQCEEKDAAFLKAVVVAGEQSPQVCHAHAMSGSPLAQSVYGIGKLQGLHVAQDVAEGMFWLRRAHNNGNGQASVVLCGAYLDGKFVTRDAGKALAYVTLAAERGFAKAQYVLACLLLDGETTAVDEERAVSLLRAAARSGDAQAIQLLQDNGLPVD